MVLVDAGFFQLLLCGRPHYIIVGVLVFLVVGRPHYRFHCVICLIVSLSACLSSPYHVPRTSLKRKDTESQKLTERWHKTLLTHGPVLTFRLYIKARFFTVNRALKFYFVFLWLRSYAMLRHKTEEYKFSELSWGTSLLCKMLVMKFLCQKANVCSLWVTRGPDLKLSLHCSSLRQFQTVF